MTLDTVFFRWVLGTALLINAPIMAQDESPPAGIPARQAPGTTNDLGPGLRSPVDRSTTESTPRDRLARRSELGRTDARQQTGPRREPWWDREAEADADFLRPNQPRATGRGDLIRSSQIIAMVGDEPILAGDLLGRINEALQQYAGKVPEEAIEQQRWTLLAQLLPSSIEAKIVYLDFLRSVPAEQSAAIRASIFQQFDEKQLPELVKKAQVAGVVELEEKMREVGGSLDKTRRLFFEQAAAREMIRRKGETQDDVTPAELLRHYQDHLDEFKIEGRVRWEQLMTLAPAAASEQKKAEAFRKLARMGNAVVGGAPFDVVARRDSEGFNAENGGRQDWTVQGSLVSEVLDEAIFTLPIGRLSDILPDEAGFHIVRVVERIEPGHTPFPDTQKGIREAIQNERREAAIKEYINELKAKTYVRNNLPPANASDQASADGQPGTSRR